MQNNMTLKLITLLHIYKLFRMIKSRRTKGTEPLKRELNKNTMF